MRAISGEVEALLAGLDEDSRHRAALLTGELIAQVTGRLAGWDGVPVGLTIELREDVRSSGGDRIGRTVSRSERRS
jgi:hypothetical protein